jgi:hypothetical protein
MDGRLDAFIRHRDVIAGKEKERLTDSICLKIVKCLE